MHNRCARATNGPNPSLQNHRQTVLTQPILPNVRAQQPPPRTTPDTSRTKATARTLNELAGHFEVHPTQVVQWKQRLVAGASEVFSGGVERDAAQEAQLRDRLYQQIGQMKVELDWLKKKPELLP